MQQEMHKYTDADKEVWKILFERQEKNLADKGATAYNKALLKMNEVLNANNIPCFEEINKWFETSTGWKIETVPGLIEVERFFELLAEKKFCSSTWLRSKENLDYLEEPDMFHDIFGHIPLLSDPVFSDFVYEFGKLGKASIGNAYDVKQLQRLYWFTIEFGVINENEKIKPYGAGIISSFGETNQINELRANFLPYDIETIKQKDFRTDVMQEDYYVIQSLDELFNSLQNSNA